MKLSDSLLSEFCGRFLGYGNPGTSTWFIGMEEGGGNSVEEIAARFGAWERRGKRDFDDIKLFCAETGHESLLPWGSLNAPSQKTWCGLIKEQGQRENKPEWVSNSLAYQRAKWLTENGETCLLNLLPLPSPKIDIWHYAAWSNLPILQTRAIYTAALVEKRIQLIRAAIQTYQPKQVIFVGVTNAEYWSQIQYGLKETAFDMIRHPAAWASRNSSNDLQSADVDVLTRHPNQGTDRKILVTDSKYDTTMFLEILSGLGIQRKPSGDYWEKIQKTSSFEFNFGYMPSRGEEFAIELKIKRDKNVSVIDKIEKDITQFEEDFANLIGHKVEWAVSGKGSSRNLAILFLWYKDRPNREQSKKEWTIRYGNLISEQIRNYFKSV